MPADIGSYSVLIGESNVAIDPAIGGYGVADIYLGEFSPHNSESSSRGQFQVQVPREIEKPLCRYLIAISNLKLRSGILTEQGEGS